MFLLGHLGIGLGLAWLLAWRSPSRIDYRLVLLGTILPDLIDKPLGFALGLETRIWAHTFLFLSVILVLSLIPAARSARFVGFGVATHLLLDQIWAQPRIVLYPAFGWIFPPAPFDAAYWFDTLLRDPVVQAGEIIGAMIIIVFAFRNRILSWKALRAFLRHGTLPQSTASHLKQG
ncbi:MAG: metal-dependent hydrolase [Thermoplasmata archaeon]